MKKPYLSVVIPAYTEEKRIGPTLASIYNYLTQQTYSWEILIVLDGPDDNTLAVIAAFAEGKEHIRWIDRKVNRGKGYTVRQGMLAAKGDIRLFTDADNSTELSYFEDMRPLFEKGTGVVIASRDRKDVETARQVVPQPLFKRLLGNAGNLFIQIMVVPGIWDTRCGFKAFTAVSANKIFSVARMDGWSYDDEALALARRYGFEIGKIGVEWNDAEGTHVTKLDYIKNIFEAVRIRWYLMTGVYNRQPSETIDLASVKINHNS